MISFGLFREQCPLKNLSRKPTPKSNRRRERFYIVIYIKSVQFIMTKSYSIFFFFLNKNKWLVPGVAPGTNRVRWRGRDEGWGERGAGRGILIKQNTRLFTLETTRLVLLSDRLFPSLRQYRKIMYDNNTVYTVVNLLLRPYVLGSTALKTGTVPFVLCTSFYRPNVSKIPCLRIKQTGNP